MKYQEYKSLVRDDFRRHVQIRGRHGWLFFLYSILLNYSMSITFWFRSIQYLQTKKNILTRAMLVFAKIMNQCCQRTTGIQINPGALIGGDIMFPHFSCIVIPSAVKIGRSCTIHQGVTIGRSFSPGKVGVPDIGDNVIIYPGAKVIGGVKIGNNAIICANAVVTHDVPDNAVVAGVPANVIGSGGQI